MSGLARLVQVDVLISRCHLVCRSIVEVVAFALCNLALRRLLLGLNNYHTAIDGVSFFDHTAVGVVRACTGRPIDLDFVRDAVLVDGQCMLLDPSNAIRSIFPWHQLVECPFLCRFQVFRFLRGRWPIKT